jgi:hypothetical protein
MCLGALNFLTFLADAENGESDHTKYYMSVIHTGSW